MESKERLLQNTEHQFEQPWKITFGRAKVADVGASRVRLIDYDSG